MSRYIDAEKIEFELCESTMPKKYRDFCKRVINDKNLTPTVVVFCKDCEHYKEKGCDPITGLHFGKCDRSADFWTDGDEVDENDFCSFAKERNK